MRLSIEQAASECAIDERVGRSAAALPEGNNILTNPTRIEHRAAGRQAFKVRETVRFTADSLEGNPDQLVTEPIKMKLLFQTDADELCAEFCMKCDAPRPYGQLREQTKTIDGL